MTERKRDIDEGATFESVYDEERKRWTLRRIRVSLPVPSGVRPSEAAGDGPDRPTVVAPQGTVTSADGMSIPLAPLVRNTPLIDAPSDLAIPVRTDRPLDTEAPLDVRVAFLLYHVDDRSTIAEIACSVGRSVAEVASAFGLLAAMGVVELVGNVAPPPPPRESGVRPALSADVAPEEPKKR